jgi:hypothetical protein
MFKRALNLVLKAYCKLYRSILIEISEKLNWLSWQYFQESVNWNYKELNRSK